MGLDFILENGEHKIKISNSIESNEYLKLIYDGKEYKINEFRKKYYNNKNEFIVDMLLKDCIVDYKGEKHNWDEWIKITSERCDDLIISGVYNEKLSYYENFVFVVDEDYYAAIRLIKSADNILQNARYALIESMNIIENNSKINWECGYCGIYLLRTIRINDAIMWYNNFFDAIMQIAFIGFGIYKKHEKYEEKMPYNKKISLCNYKFLSDFYGNNKEIPNLKSLWKIVSKSKNINQNVNKWANFIKHKGGLDYKGIKIENPFFMSVKDANGETMYQNDDFDSPVLELDDVIKELERVNNEQCTILKDLADFFEFEKACCRNINGKEVLPKTEEYKKIIINK